MSIVLNIVQILFLIYAFSLLLGSVISTIIKRRVYIKMFLLGAIYFACAYFSYSYDSWYSLLIGFISGVFIPLGRRDLD